MCSVFFFTSPNGMPTAVERSHFGLKDFINYEQVVGRKQYSNLNVFVLANTGENNNNNANITAASVTHQCVCELKCGKGNKINENQHLNASFTMNDINVKR